MSRKTTKRIKSRILEDQGITSTEYAIMAALIAVVVIAAVGFLGSELTRSYLGLANTMANG